MSIELKTVMGQMNIVGGRWVSEAPNALAVREPTDRLRSGLSTGASIPQKGDLFVVVEIRGISREEEEGQGLGRSLAETIRNTYYQTSGSVTASLRHALLAANEQLLGESYRRSGAATLIGGVTTVVVRGEDAFMALVGPAVTYAVTRGVVTQFPETSPWLGMADPQATGAPALGRRASVDAQLFHVRVEPGDMLVLGDSRFAARTSPSGVEKASAYQGVEGALSNLGKLTGGHDCTALVVEIQAQSTGPLRRREEARHSDPGLYSREPVSSRMQSGQTVSTSDAAPPVTVAQVGGGVGKFAGVGRTVRRNAGGVRPRIPIGRWLSALGKALLALLMVLWTGLRTLISRVLPGQEPEETARRTGAKGQARRADTRLLPQRILRTVALAIPAVVLITVGFIYWQRGLTRENEFNDLVEQAQTAYQQALNADNGAARDLLAQSDALLTQADAIKPGDVVIGELRESIAGQQDKINRVERLYWVGLLRKYDSPGTQLRRAVVNGLDVYVLDVGTDQVYHHRLDEVGDALEPDEADPALVRRGQQVETAVVGEMIDLVWMPAGGNRQTSDLLILESGGLLEHNPSWGLTPLPIANKDAWALPVAVGSYFGNFYILDPQVGQILRYVPDADGYASPAQYYFPDGVKIDLTGAVDMAIDGFIYVLYADGTIRKFEGGVPVEFQITEIDKPLSRPIAIHTAPDDVALYIYVADAGNRRIVQLEKNGRFVRQFKLRDEESINLETLQSIFVDELTGKLYLLTTDSLYVANIAPVQLDSPSTDSTSTDNTSTDNTSTDSTNTR